MFQNLDGELLLRRPRRAARSAAPRSRAVPRPTKGAARAAPGARARAETAARRVRARRVPREGRACRTPPSECPRRRARSVGRPPAPRRNGVQNRRASGGHRRRLPRRGRSASRRRRNLARLSAEQLRNNLVELRAGGVCLVRVEDLGHLLDLCRERGVRNHLAVRKRSPPHRTRAVFSRNRRELAREPRLADTRRSEERYELRVPLLDDCGPRFAGAPRARSIARASARVLRPVRPVLPTRRRRATRAPAPACLLRRPVPPPRNESRNGSRGTFPRRR